MQFRPPRPPQVRAVRPAQRPPGSDRDCPLDTAGDRCLWHVGGTAGENDDAPTGGVGSRRGPEVRSVLGDHGIVGKPRTRRGSVTHYRQCGRLDPQSILKLVTAMS
jgi:hypothetical protein